MAHTHDTGRIAVIGARTGRPDTADADAARGPRPLRTDGPVRQAAFRSRATGAVVVTGACHDITLLPGGLDADLDEWEAGFTDAEGRFLDRREAAAAAGHRGRLEARAWFSGDAAPTLEAGHRESWRMLRTG